METITKYLIRNLTHNGDDCDGDHSDITSTLISLQQNNHKNHGHAHNQSHHDHGKTGGTFVELIKQFLTRITSTLKGKVLLTIWTSFVVGVYLLKNKKKKKKKTNTTPQHGHSHGTKGAKGTKTDTKTTAPPTSKSSITLLQVATFIYKTIQPRLTSLFGLKLVFYVALLTFRIRVTVKLATLTGRMGSYFGSRRWNQMFDGQVTFGLWCMVAAATTSTMKYMEKVVALDFRTILYEKLHSEYFNSNASSGNSVMYNLGFQMTDAPARITSDLKIFSNLVAHEFGHIVKPIIDMSYLTIDLTQQIGIAPLTVFLSFFYWSKTALSKTRAALPTSMSELSRLEINYEATLTTNAQQIHDFREEISMQNGQKSEGT